jgi:glycosylphosphatidylinositol transamidase (GPIT) subunit GPI8
MNKNEHFDKLVNLSAQDTERAAALVAKSFYKVLRKNGFSDDQIISVANNLLGCLIHALDGYKKKSEKEEIKSQETKAVYVANNT